jgi:hypothetical protein
MKLDFDPNTILCIETLDKKRILVIPGLQEDMHHMYFWPLEDLPDDPKLLTYDQYTHHVEGKDYIAIEALRLYAKESNQEEEFDFPNIYRLCEALAKPSIEKYFKYKNEMTNNDHECCDADHDISAKYSQSCSPYNPCIKENCCYHSGI